jgi:hypothetical protein
MSRSVSEEVADKNYSHFHAKKREDSKFYVVDPLINNRAT